MRAILALLILVVLVFAVYTTLHASVEIQAGLLSFIGAVLMGLYAHFETNKREIAARHFSEKQAAYKGFIEFLFEMIQQTKNKKPISESELSSKMMEFKQNLMIWGIAELIAEWHKYEALADKKPDSKDILHKVENILAAIRQDLGHDDSLLKFGQLCGLFIIEKDKGEVFELSK